MDQILVISKTLYWMVTVED
ncbi:unnamed protein product, partial [Tuber melanosporum]